MTKVVVCGVFLVVAVQALAMSQLERDVVIAVTGVALACVLLAARSHLTRRRGSAGDPAIDDAAATSLRNWLSRTETLIAWSESSRTDWDRRLRPMLARQFELATGQRQARNHAAFHATGSMLFGAELWAWVDPENVSRTGDSEPGPGRDALDEILRRLEQV